ncbi:hypothetical protein B005_4599 [Nocardiopsis alba ATCC BAA-2165]|uniref:Uncharacterized protein n=1 Tax=Nocardiopsis alba (strain ATCC BAA-2165 / BE74) TaxID=1205910 RepID=J7LA14_NOCAA|nr:hypothetical protein B005_4599 [Nocardiopsis alba ATCC BAA-2165]
MNSGVTVTRCSHRHHLEETTKGRRSFRDHFMSSPDGDRRP